MKRTPQVSGDRLPLLITIVVFVVMLGCLPLVLMLDTGIDGDRPMYHDMDDMERLQSTYIATGQPPVEVQLSDGQSVTIGETEFTVSNGVTLTVRTTQDYSFCITARNEEGATSKRCSD